MLMSNPKVWYRGCEGDDGHEEGTVCSERGRGRKKGLTTGDGAVTGFPFSFAPVCAEDLLWACTYWEQKARSVLSLSKGEMSTEQLSAHRRPSSTLLIHGPQR